MRQRERKEWGTDKEWERQTERERQMERDTCRIQRDKETENTSSLSIASALKHVIHAYFHYLLIFLKLYSIYQKKNWSAANLTMFFPSNVQIHWHVLVGSVKWEWRLRVMGVQIPQEVPRRIHEGVHCICLSLCWCTASMKHLHEFSNGVWFLARSVLIAEKALHLYYCIFGLCRCIRVQSVIDFLFRHMYLDIMMIIKIYIEVNSFYMRYCEITLICGGKCPWITKILLVCGCITSCVASMV